MLKHSSAMLQKVLSNQFERSI